MTGIKPLIRLGTVPDGLRGRARAGGGECASADGLNRRAESLSASRFADVAGVASPISGRAALGGILGLVLPGGGARCCPLAPGRAGSTRAHGWQSAPAAGCSVILPQLLVAANSTSRPALLDGDAAMTPSHRAGELARQGPAAAAAGWDPDLLDRRQAAVGPV